MNCRYLGLLLLACIAVGSVGCNQSDPSITLEPVSSNRGVFKNPGDIIRFKGKLVATEIFANRLAIFDTIDSRSPVYLDGKKLGKKLRSPHHLALSPWGTLLISNGWGTSIVEIEDLQGKGWKEFSGIDIPFHAPHGICSDEDGWIYVADSLNSRVVRFKNMEGDGWEVFADIEKKISYVRQLVCTEEGIWAANSYEKREGLNPGQGGNLLFIRDFDSGRISEEFVVSGDHLTAVRPLGQQLAFAVFHGYPNLGVVSRLDHKDIKQITDFPKELGVLYSLYYDENTHNLLAVYFGSFGNKGGNNLGGIAAFKVSCGPSQFECVAP